MERILKNINFFRIHDLKISNALQNMLEGKASRFKLIFNKSDINILDIKQNIALFPKNRFIDTHINIASSPLHNPSWRIYNNNISISKVFSKDFPLSSNAINKIIDLVGEKDSNLYHLPSNFLPQTNIFGLCGGLFLELLLEAGYSFHSLLIFEEDMELFCISCAFVDYEKLFSASKSCYIFIENINHAFLTHYFYTKKITNNFLRLELNAFRGSKIDKFKKMVNESYRANSRGWGSFEDEIRGLKNTFLNIKKYNVLDFKNIKKLNIPICVVGSGPSLEESFDFLKRNQNRMLIFSCCLLYTSDAADDLQPV